MEYITKLFNQILNPDYTISNNKIIFDKNFNKPLEQYYEILTKCKELYFCELTMSYKKKMFYAIDLYDWNYQTRNTMGNLSRFNSPVNNLPSNLTHIYFGDCFSQPVDSLPSKLTHLSFGFAFNKYVWNLPSNLIILIFGNNFNKPISNLPSQITHLILGYNFSQPVDNLPPKLTHLMFGREFNHPVSNLPIQLTHLIFGENFSQSVDYLPSSLIYLSFGAYFNYPVNNLPQNLKIIKFSEHSQYNFDLNCLPNSVELLQLPRNYDKYIEKIPTHLTKIICDNSYDKYNRCNKIK